MAEKISVIGGTGNLGAAIARRLAKAGHSVIIGSRAEESAQSRAGELGFGLIGRTNADAARWADIIIVTVPFAAQEATLLDIALHCAGKIVVDATVPLVPPKVMRVQLPVEGSAAQRAQRVLGDSVTIVSAFHNVAAHKLASDEYIDCDVMVFGEDKAAREKVVQLSNTMGLRAFHAGALCNSAAAEAMTSILIFINKNYAAGEAGIRLTGNFDSGQLGHPPIQELGSVP